MIEIKLHVSEELVDAAYQRGGAFSRRLKEELGLQAYQAAVKVVESNPDRSPIVSAEAE